MRENECIRNERKALKHNTQTPAITITRGAYSSMNEMRTVVAYSRFRRRRKTLKKKKKKQKTKSLYVVCVYTLEIGN